MRSLSAAVASAAILALSVVAGCSTHGGLTTAHSVGDGNLQVAIEPGVGAYMAAGNTLVLPQFNVGVRYGLSDRAEIGGRIGTSLYEVTGKYVFTDPEADTVISIAPSGSLIAFGGGGVGAGYFNYQVPLLFGIPSGENQIVVGPKLRHSIYFGGGGGTSAGGQLVMIGGVAAYSIKVSEKFRFHPELAVDVPVLATASASGAGSVSGAGYGGLVVGVNAGLMFGGN